MTFLACIKITTGENALIVQLKKTFLYRVIFDLYKRQNKNWDNTYFFHSCIMYQLFLKWG